MNVLVAAALTLLPIAVSETDTTITYHTQVRLTVDEPAYIKAVNLLFEGSPGVPSQTSSYIGSVPRGSWQPVACGFGGVGVRAYFTGNGAFVSSGTTLGSFDFTYQRANLPAELSLLGEHESGVLDCGSWVNLDWQVVYPDVQSGFVALPGDCDWDGDVDFDDITPFVDCLGASGLEVGEPADLDGDGDCDFDDVDLFLERLGV